MTICEGLATGFAILAVGAMLHWCTEAVEDANYYEWEVEEQGVAVQLVETVEPDLLVVGSFAKPMRTRVRACAATCSAFSEWSGARAIPLDATGDGIVGGPDYFALRRAGAGGPQWSVFRTWFGHATGWYP